MDYFHSLSTIFKLNKLRERNGELQTTNSTYIFTSVFFKFIYIYIFFIDMLNIISNCMFL